ncbi:MAG: TfoX/Sxy family protein [Burkholderiales bacterium]
MKMTGKHDGMALAGRVRKALGSKRNVTEKRMMGGVCFLLRQHMLCGTAKQGYLFRVGNEQDAEALARPGATTLAFTGPRKRGFVWVDPEGCDARALKGWIALAERYVASLPPKRS